MSTKPPDVSKLIRRGNHYAKSRQWDYSAAAFIQICKRLTRGESRSLRGLDPARLQSALQQLQGQPVAMAGSIMNALCRELYSALLASHNTRECKGKSHMMAFQSPAIDVWIVVYHDRTPLLPFDSQLADMTVPAGRSCSFILKFRQDAVESTYVTSTMGHQIAYALAHLGYARVNKMLDLYSEHQILNHIGIHAVKKAGQYYDFALALRPDYSWAFTHIGEMYRDIANSWYSHDQWGLRILYYVMSLVYYDKAIGLNPNDFWAHAHFGAAVVNVRVFAGIQGIAPEHEHYVELLARLLDTWFLKEAPSRRYDALLDRAMHSLVVAQRLEDNFYPWAEAYYAGTLLLKSVARHDKKHHELGLLALETTVQAYFSQPSMVEGSFEPGELYVNGFYQIGLLHLWSGKLSLAWKWTRLGMNQISMFHFLPGVDALLGFLLLVMTSVEMINLKASPKVTENHPATIPELQSYDIWGKDISVSGVEIPFNAYTSKDSVVKFIVSIFYDVAYPSTMFFLENLVPNTNIEMGLVVLDYVVSYFGNVVSMFSMKSGDGLMSQTAKKLEGDIRAYREIIHGLLFDEAPPHQQAHHRLHSAAAAASASASVSASPSPSLSHSYSPTASYPRRASPAPYSVSGQGRTYTRIRENRVKLAVYDHSLANIYGCLHTPMPGLHMLHALRKAFDAKR